MFRTAVLLLGFASVLPGWVQSVEFPWNAVPRQLWERDLVWLKNIGIRHISLPPPDESNGGQLAEAIRILRRMDLEADLEGPVPAALESMTRAHGGPLTDPFPVAAVRISALSNTALTHSREVISAGAPAALWTDVLDTMGAAGYRAGAVNFAGEEGPGTVALLRETQLAAYWDKTFPALLETVGAPPRSGIATRQFVGENGISVVSIVNQSGVPWTGDLKAAYPRAKRIIALPGVSVPAHDVLWLPVNVPLTAGPLCRNCSAFANVDHLVYATAELTGMEYENGILAMEFAAPAGGEALLQLSREPYGPFVAGGKPVSFDWDEHEMRARLKIPPGSGRGGKVRIGLAIEPPDATGFFDSARVLLIGETNRLPAQFSSEAIARRSRLRTTPPLEVAQAPAGDPPGIVYSLKVPSTAIPGDHAELALEADGIQMSHARPQLLAPAALIFPDAVSVHLAAGSALPLMPATVPVNKRTGREITLTVRNNAPEIRNFHVEIAADGVQFSPAQMDVVVGASASRDLLIRVFATAASAGLHEGVAKLSGASPATVPVQFVVIPQNGSVAFSADRFSLIESARFRAAFLPGRWLEMLDKENNQNLIGSAGLAFTAGPVEAKNDTLIFGGQRTVKLEDLQQLVPRPKR